jgi:hypothetical protein
MGLLEKAAVAGGLVVAGTILIAVTGGTATPIVVPTVAAEIIAAEALSARSMPGPTPEPGPRTIDADDTSQKKSAPSTPRLLAHPVHAILVLDDTTVVRDFEGDAHVAVRFSKRERQLHVETKNIEGVEPSYDVRLTDEQFAEASRLLDLAAKPSERYPDGAAIYDAHGRLIAKKTIAVEQYLKYLATVADERTNAQKAADQIPPPPTEAEGFLESLSKVGR